MTKAQTALAAEAHWWINHESLMDYEQDRPVPVVKIKARSACKTDCSGLVYGLWWGRGFPDPTGGEYTTHDIVYTGTLLTANDRVGSIADLQVGDLCIFGTTESTEHVAFVIEAGADPLLCSHCSKAGRSGCPPGNAAHGHRSCRCGAQTCPPTQRRLATTGSSTTARGIGSARRTTPRSGLPATRSSTGSTGSSVSTDDTTRRRAWLRRRRRRQRRTLR